MNVLKSNLYLNFVQKKPSYGRCSMLADEIINVSDK